ncbi:SDR family oxidoreductase [Pelomyxa schiedti]|nr:SDR family oxidoreductase [Pelomyxa schiedti]
MSRLIVITGGTRGLGLAMARELMSLGHVVATCGRDPKAVESLSGEMRATSPRSSCSVVDVTDPAAVLRWASQVGAPDVVLSNAAVGNRLAPMWEITPEELDKIYKVNVAGVHNVMRAFIPIMLQSGKQGLIANFSSEWGRSVDALVGPYCMSKFAVEAMTRAAAAELTTATGGASRIACVALNPGIVNTALLDTCAAAFGAHASDFWTPEVWVKRAVPYILSLTTADNGKSLSCPYPDSP